MYVVKFNTYKQYFERTLSTLEYRIFPLSFMLAAQRSFRKLNVMFELFVWSHSHQVRWSPLPLSAVQSRKTYFRRFMCVCVVWCWCAAGMREWVTRHEKISFSAGWRGEKIYSIEDTHTSHKFYMAFVAFSVFSMNRLGHKRDFFWKIYTIRLKIFQIFRWYWWKT